MMDEYNFQMAMGCLLIIIYYCYLFTIFPGRVPQPTQTTQSESKKKKNKIYSRRLFAYERKRLMSINVYVERPFKWLLTNLSLASFCVHVRFICFFIGCRVDCRLIRF